MARAGSGRLRAVFRRRWVRRVAIGAGSLAAVALLALAGLWFRLASGPISLDLATPWLAAAIAENFGSQHRVEVGGTQIERDDKGRVKLRLRDIAVRDRDGSVVASAPKAEVGLSGSGLFSGDLRAESLRLVGAELAVRIEPDGTVNVFAANDEQPRPDALPAAHPIASASPAPAKESAPSAVPDAASDSDAPDGHDRLEWLPSLLAWIDGLGKSGLDGHDLSELGLKNGRLTVKDERTGKTWKLSDIDVSLRRAAGGGVAFKVSSEQPNRKWSLTAVVTPRENGMRSMLLQAERVPSQELLLALRLRNLPIETDLPLSARLRVDIGPTGSPSLLEGAVFAQAGFVSDPGRPKQRLAIEQALVNIRWDARRHVLVVPVHVVAGGNRFTLLGQIAPPRQPGGEWQCQFGGGSIVLTGSDAAKPPLVLDRIFARVSYDPVQRRAQFEQGELGNAQMRVAFSGSLDFSAEPRLALGIAARPMTLDTMIRLWPPIFAQPARQWVREHVSDGRVERADIAINASLAVLFDPKKHLSDDALSIGLTGQNVVLRPLPTLPPIRDATMNVRITGRTATVSVAQATVPLPSGRTLSISNAAFEVANTVQEPPLSLTRMQVDGTVSAAAELMRMEPLHSTVGTTEIDPATSKGTVSAQVTLGIPLMDNPPAGTTTYSAAVEFTNFSAEHLVSNYRLEAEHLHLSAENGDLRIQGEVKIGGLPAAVELAQRVGSPLSELHLRAVLDDAARRKLGLNFGQTLTGPVPIEVTGSFGAPEGGDRFAVEADLTQATLNNLMPGWTKSSGKAAHARFTLLRQKQISRLEEFVLNGAGVSVRGTLQLDSSGAIVSADFPVFSLSARDRASLKLERKSDGTLRAVLHGDLYDATQFLQQTAAGSSTTERGGKADSVDLDLEVKLGTVAGFHVETLRAVNMKLVRKGGRLRSFSLTAKLGHDSALSGEMRTQRGGRPGLVLHTDDAGALLRFVNLYSRVFGGQMTVVMDPPSEDQVPQNGVVKIRNFTVRGETALDRVVAGAPSQQRQGIQFSSLEMNFARSPGRLTIREGVVRGPIIGATLDGTIDYRNDTVRARGVLVPLYSLNNLFGQLPIVGFFLGGGFNSQNEGLLGINYQVVGSPGAPELLVNPVSAVAPGIIRKFIPNLFNVPTQPSARPPGPNSPPAYSDTSR